MFDPVMPRVVRSVITYRNCISPKTSNKRYKSPTRYEDLRNRRPKPPLKTFAEQRKKSSRKPTKILKFSSQDIFGLPLVHFEEYFSPCLIDYTQRRRYSCSAGVGGRKFWEDSGARVAIIGAGVAGLSAADHLINHGVTNINIFEATSRLGGRINTAKFANGGTCELGAEWLSGGDMSNGLVALANQEGLTANADWRYNRQIICLLKEGKTLNSDLCYFGRKIFNKIRSEVFRLYKTAPHIKHGTLAYYLNKRFDEEISNYSDNWSSCLQRLKCALINDLRVRFGVDLSMMSSDTVGSSSEEPQDAMRLKGGLVNALLPLIRDIPKEKIHLDSPVKTIFWEPGKTSVVLDNNTHVPADYIIVTVPLGFLKKNHLAFFHPHLPPSKVEAIDIIGVGNVTKIFMKYSSALWGVRRTDMSTIWKTGDWSDRDLYWYRGVSLVSVQDDVAEVVVGGPEAVTVENEPVDVIARDLTALLRCFTNASFLPMPTELIKSQYNLDEWYNGSGSYLPLEAKSYHFRNLVEPLSFPHSVDPPSVFFAGEATYTQDLNTVHGARKSGIREAQRIINMVCPVVKDVFKFKRKCSIER